MSKDKFDMIKAFWNKQSQQFGHQAAFQSHVAPRQIWVLFEHATITVCELTEWTFAAHLNTLIAAYAETGDFEQAAICVTKAIELVTSSRKEEYKAGLEHYQSGKPHHPVPAAKR
jgi:hypothetical protein